MIHCCAFPSETLCPHSEPCELHALRAEVAELTRERDEARRMAEAILVEAHRAADLAKRYADQRDAILTRQGLSQ